MTCTFIVGGSGTGKSTELARRVLAAAQNAPVLVTSVSGASLNALRGRIAHPNVRLCELHEFALECLPQAEQIDDVRAATLFEEAAQPLLTLEWREIIEAQVDPEVPGLRAPERFLDSAFRLFCKLRDARITPEHFLETALRGAAQFYAKPPNLAHPDLLYYTKDNHRDSLVADGAELQRQYRREIDLAKILAKLYRSYLEHPVKQGCLTPRDVIAQAADVLQVSADAARALRERYPAIFVDDVQELTI
ncbi:MAG TPA: UvrD-helicase domain-containing protein, partial [Candidatus Baltobacteraceae bacterium]|nr:UvrD-helicase domain-containing protein [Candidatus Baltobacteraceae bacterium]